MTKNSQLKTIMIMPCFFLRLLKSDYLNLQENKQTNRYYGKQSNNKKTTEKYICRTQRSVVNSSEGQRKHKVLPAGLRVQQ